MVVMSAKKAKETGIEPSGTILAQECTTAEPAGISWVPSLAIKKALGRTGMILDNLDLIEINEAFAAVTLVSTKILAGEKDGVWDSVLQKTNVNGGAVAIGHPVGASGLRILMTLMYELRRRGGGTGAAGICGGLAQGEAVIIRT
jgi:acetyl-CoA C-acetyltransferase